MTPYIIHHHLTPSSDSEYRNREHEYRKRHKSYRHDDPKRQWRSDNDSDYGETVYKYEPEYNEEWSFVPPYNNHYGNSRYGKRLYFQRQPPPHSEPPLRHESEPQDYFEISRKTYRDTKSEPRIALLNKRPGTNRHSHCDCHACPEKSSKMIPGMFYDELRCPHCSAYAQPTQNEVLTYPWTAQSFRPNRRTARHGSQLQEDFSSTSGSVAPASVTSRTGSVTQSYRSPSLSVDDTRSFEGKENVSLVAPTKPMFRGDGISTRSEFKRRVYNPRYPESTVSKRHLAMSMIDEDAVDDDVRPQDSVSNVSLPPLRAQSIDQVQNYRSGRRTGAESEVDATYTREKYFQSLNNNDLRQPIPEPKQRVRRPVHTPRQERNISRQERNISRQISPTPRPLKDTASQISRMLKGEYYDRRNGRTYKFNVNYAQSQIQAVREPKI